MKYEAEINGRQMTVELEERDDHLTATIGERRYEIAVARPEDGVYVLFLGNEVYEAHVWAEADGQRVKLRDRTFEAKIIDRKHRHGAADHGIEGRQQLTAPMPGKVVRVLRLVGDEVAAGEGVVVVEAMKMQNEIKSPKVGRIQKLMVHVGDALNAGDVVAIVE